MANDNIDDDGEDGAAAPKSSKLTTILVLVNVLVSGAALFKILSLPSEPVIVNTISADEGASNGDPEQPGPVEPFDPFLVNLNEPGGGRFLRITVEVEVKNEDGLATLQAHKRKIRDELLRYLSNLRVEETLGETNRLRIRDGIISRIGTLLDNDKLVKGVYFPDFVVQ